MSLTIGLVALMACDEARPQHDAGNPTADAALIDSGVADAGRPDAATTDASNGPCAATCSGQCFRQRCVPQRPRSCEDRSDCPEDEKCSVVGECYGGECLSHGDCAEDQRCAVGRCLGRVDPSAGVTLERVYPTALNEHISPVSPRDYATSYGFGVGLFDLDGDLDLDVFLGSQNTQNGGSSACIYRNDSIPGELRFEAIDAYCQPGDRSAISGFGLDLDNDGYHELLVTGPRLIKLHRFHPEHQVIDLRGSLPAGDDGLNCYANSAVALDLNHDGRIDLMVGCGERTPDPSNRILNSTLSNLAFLQTEEGDLQRLTRQAWDPQGSLLLDAQGFTHAIGAADVDADGLLDLIVSDEPWYYPDDPRSSPSDPGGIYRRCSPDQACQHEAIRLGEDDRRFGSYMGSGLLQIEGQGEFVYITDLGPNRLVQVDDGRVRDIATSSRAALGHIGLEPVFSWGVVVDDFDRDGRDDLFISNGSALMHSQVQFDAHFDALLLQRDQAEFVLHSADLGIAPFTQTDSHHDERPYSSRATVKADLDGDGFLDLLTAGMEGVPRLHREVPNQRPDPPRCTLVPIDRYVVGFGVGHAIIADGDPRPRQWDSQGQHRSGASPFVLTPWTRGTLRFPSGAEVPYDCQGLPGPFIVNEPEWLVLNTRGQTLSITVGAEAPSGTPSVYCEPSGQTVIATPDGTQQFSAQLPPGTERFMLRFDQRWVPRWWQP